MVASTVRQTVYVIDGGGHITQSNHEELHTCL